MFKNKKGFTLIELLVVIAIIGILSSVVLASLNTARNKGADSAVKGGFGQLRAQAALYYDSYPNSYGSAGVTCSTAGSVFAPTSSQAIINNITKNSLGLYCANDASNWYAVSALKGGGSYCVDDKGANKSYTTATTTITLSGGCI